MGLGFRFHGFSGLGRERESGLGPLYAFRSVLHKKVWDACLP